MDTWYDQDLATAKKERRILFFVVVTVLGVIALCCTLILTVGLLTSFNQIVYEDPPVSLFHHCIYLFNRNIH